MEKRFRSTRHGCREKRTNRLADWDVGPAFWSTTRKSSPSANEKQSRPHWQNARVEFQVGTAQLQSSEIPTRGNTQCLFFELMPTKAAARSRLRNFLTQSTGPFYLPWECLYGIATRSIRSTPNRTSSFRTPDSASIAPETLSL